LGISKGSGSRFEVRNERVDGEVAAAAAAVYSDRGGSTVPPMPPLARETDTIYLVIMRMGLWWAIRTKFGAVEPSRPPPSPLPVAPGRLIMETNRINKR